MDVPKVERCLVLSVVPQLSVVSEVQGVNKVPLLVLAQEPSVTVRALAH